MLKKGDKAPGFILEGDDGSKHSLKDFENSTLILYFYPKDNTSGCTTEAQEFSALSAKFGSKNAVIVGVSPDSTDSHRDFKEKAGITFLLLSDPDKSVAKAYGAYGEKTMYGKKSMGIIRSTFVIKDGIIQELWTNVKAKGHAEMVCSLI